MVEFGEDEDSLLEESSVIEVVRTPGLNQRVLHVKKHVFPISAQPIELMP
jgi:hypothetical protein